VKRVRYWIAAAAALAASVLVAATISTSCGDDEDAQDLTWEQLRNATYPSTASPDEEVVLVNGQTAAEEGKTPSARLVDVGAFGDLGGDDGLDAAVFLAESAGDGERVTSLIAVVDDGDELAIEGSAELAIDVVIRSVEVDDGEIVVKSQSVESTNAEPGEATEVTSRYELGRNGLELGDEETATIEVRSPEEFEYTPSPLEPTAGQQSLSRTLGPRGIDPFVISGVEGQHLELSLASAQDSAVLSIQGLSDESQVVAFRDYSSQFVGYLPSAQDYSVLVISVLGSDLDVQVSYALAEPPAPTPTPAPLPPPQTPGELAATVPQKFSGAPALGDSPLSSVSSAAAAFIPGRVPPRGVAVVVPDDGLVYVDNADQQMETASVIKVVVMTCVMSRAEQQGRLVSDWELSLMWPMITQSNNDATDALWSDLGGGPGVASCINGLGVGGITPYNGPYWGTSTASARGIATLMARIAYGDIVNAEHRAAALGMLVSVIPGQRWGVPAGADANAEEIVGVKDGWYPDDDGWRVNSVGFISPQAFGEVPYAIAVMTNGQSTQEYGIVTIEGVAEPVWNDVRAR
jgi:hypothetical protein